MPNSKAAARIPFATGFLLTIILCAQAQSAAWSDLNLPSEGSVTVLASAGGTLWAGTKKGGLYRNETGRGSWTVAMRMTSSPAPATGILASGPVLYASFGSRVDLSLWDCMGGPSACGGDPREAGGLFRSDDGGKSWTKTPLKAVTAMHAYDGTVYAVTLTGIYSSRDGAQWKKLGIDPALRSGSFAVLGVRRAGSEIFLASWAGVVRMSLSGDSLIFKGYLDFGNQSGKALTAIGDDVLASTGSAVYHTRPGSAIWDTLPEAGCDWMGEDSGKILAYRRGSADGQKPSLILSGPPTGTGWATTRAGGDVRYGIGAVCRHQGEIFGSQEPLAVSWLGPSDVAGEKVWLRGGLGLYETPVSAVAALGNLTLVGKGSGGSFLRKDDTATQWRYDNTDDYPRGTGAPSAITVAGSRLFASAGATLYAAEGMVWKRLDSLPSDIVAVAAGNGWVAAYEESQGRLLICGDPGLSQVTCTRLSPPIPLKDPNYSLRGYLSPYFPRLSRRLAADGDLLAFAGDSLYVSPDRGLSWINRGRVPGLGIHVLRALPGRLYAAGMDYSTGKSVPAVAMSGDSGKTWTRVAGLLQGRRDLLDLALRPGEVYIATDSGAYRAKEGSGSWEDLTAGLPDPSAQALALDGDRLLAGLAAGSVWEMRLEPTALRAPSVRARPARLQAPMGAYRDAKGQWRRLDGALRSRMPGGRNP